MGKALARDLVTSDTAAMPMSACHPHQGVMEVLPTPPALISSTIKIITWVERGCTDQSGTMNGTNEAQYRHSSSIRIACVRLLACGNKIHLLLSIRAIQAQIWAATNDNSRRMQAYTFHSRPDRSFVQGAVRVARIDDK